jgi:predicted RNA-binding protein with PIN domain
VSIGPDDPEAIDDTAAVDGAETDGEEDGPALPPIPDALLAPLLDSAGEALRRLPPIELPPAARRLRSFDRRGLATPAARHQLRSLLEENEAVVAATAAVFKARPEVAQLAEAWDEAMAAGGDAPVALVRGMAAEGRLPLLASVLIAGLPDSFEFGLGLVVAMAATAERESEAEALSRAATAAQRAAEEAARRAEAARGRADAEVARLESALREERQERRGRDQQAAGSEARQAELETALADAQQQLAAAERRAADADQRASGADQRASDADRRAAEAERRASDAERRAAESDRRAATAATEAATAVDRARRAENRTGPDKERAAVADPAVLERLAHAADELAAGLRLLADGAPPAPAGPPPPPSRLQPAMPAAPGKRPRQSSPRRRAPVRLPPGMQKDDPAAIEAMIRTPGLAVIVDGYNVSMLAWPTANPAEQRERLCDALAEFQLRFRCEVTVVFDGAEVPGVRPLRRRNLRVVFSAAGQEADEVVVGEVMFRPEDVPVIVVSSDREVRAAAESEGATVLAADELLQLMRR